MPVDDELLKKQVYVVSERLSDYQRDKIIKSRERLIKAWRQAHPKAARERSVLLHPLMQISRRVDGDDPTGPDEEWANDVYHVTVRRHKVDPVFGSPDGMVQLGISTHDGTARHDWREFLVIKSQLAGLEWEAFELYPANSRLLDPSNYYSLWCVNFRIPVGHGPERRLVLDSHEAIAPQRALPKENR